MMTDGFGVAGYKVIRFWNNDVKKDIYGVIWAIKLADSDGFCGCGMKVGSDGLFYATFKGKSPRKARFLLSDGTF